MFSILLPRAAELATLSIASPQCSSGAERDDQIAVPVTALPPTP
jgi:hypothetical protein